MRVVSVTLGPGGSAAVVFEQRFLWWTWTRTWVLAGRAKPAGWAIWSCIETGEGSEQNPWRETPANACEAAVTAHRMLTAANDTEAVTEARRLRQENETLRAKLKERGGVQ